MGILQRPMSITGLALIVACVPAPVIDAGGLQAMTNRSLANTGKYVSCRHCTLKVCQFQIEAAAGIASGHGEFGLSNQLWAFAADLKARAAEVYDQAHPAHQPWTAKAVQ